MKSRSCHKSTKKGFMTFLPWRYGLSSNTTHPCCFPSQNITKNVETYQSPMRDLIIEHHLLKICSKCTGEHPCQSLISIKLLRSFIEIKLRHECSPVSLLCIFRTPFTKNTSGWLFWGYLEAWSYIITPCWKSALTKVIRDVLLYEISF